MVCVMFNIWFFIIDVFVLVLVQKLVEVGVWCDFVLFFGVLFENVGILGIVVGFVVGLKFYFNEIFFELWLDSVVQWMEYFEIWFFYFFIVVYVEQ